MPVMPQSAEPDADAARPRAKPLGQRLVDAGLLTEEQLDLALRERARHGGYLGETLVALGFISPEVLARALAAESETPVVDVASAVVAGEVLALVPHHTARRLRALPITRDGDTLTVALADPFDVTAIDTLERTTGLRLDVVTAPEPDIAEAIERHYTGGTTIEELVEAVLHAAPETAGDARSDDDRSPMIRLVNQLVVSALEARATDIHIEPDEKVLRVRARIDGVLEPLALVPGELATPIAARIKVMADLNVAEKRLPQDGRIRFHYGQRVVDLRVSTLPVKHGESVVMRVLEGTERRVRFSDLGLAEADAEHVLEALERPWGMVLVTGPTGSGKTTTLYGALERIDATRRSVFTLEDPIEYSLPLVRQTPVRTDIGMTFAAGLRALLRQDPDVIVVGEVRDTETAQLAVRAALTGHLVLSTLHTNDAAGVVPRLIDMGVERYLLPSALSVLIGQRLLRRLCPDCREADPEPDPRLVEHAEAWPQQETPIVSYRGHGCAACRDTGYRGRLGIYEVLVIDESFHDLIVEGAGAAEIARHGRSRGMTSMLEDGMRKAAAGLTTVDEVLRVTV